MEQEKRRSAVEAAVARLQAETRPDEESVPSLEEQAPAPAPVPVPVTVLPPSVPHKTNQPESAVPAPTVAAAFSAMDTILSRVTEVTELSIIIPTTDKDIDGVMTVVDGVTLALATPMFLRHQDCVSFIYDNRYLKLNVNVGVSLAVLVGGERLNCVVMMRSINLPGTTWSFISFVLPTSP